MKKKFNQKVIDSNAMQDNLLRSYLRASPNNYAVINDYASMEAYKGNTLVSIFRSMEIATDFPQQMIVLKPTGRICALRGQKRGLQRRMIDERHTREFPIFCKRLRAARGGNIHFQAQLLEKGRVANDQMDRILLSTPEIPSAISELRKIFTKEELNNIRIDKPFSHELIMKSMKFIIDLTLHIISVHPSPPARIRSLDELQNTFLFRQSVAIFVWSLDWITRGGANGMRPDRMRNDIIDVVFVTYATFFDGLISNDKKAQRIYHGTQHILTMLNGTKDA